MPYLNIEKIILKNFRGVEDTLGRRYLYSFYWSTLMLTTIGEVGIRKIIFINFNLN